MNAEPQRPTQTGPLPPAVDRLVRILLPVVLLLFFVPAIFAAVVIPYHEWDALSFGTWSRVIAAHGQFHFAGITDLGLQRPLLYVGQGIVWAAFGYHEWLGRLLSLAFAGLLVLSIATLAGRGIADAATARLVRLFAVAIVVGSAGVAAFADSGLTDVPVAATAAATAALAWSRIRRSIRLPLVAVAGTATVLAKPTGLLPLVGLIAAFLLSGRREAREAVLTVSAIATGIVLALAYDETQARYLHEPLTKLLQAGNDNSYVSQASKVRWHVLLRGDWLGAPVRVLVLYGIVYGIGRALLRGRRATAAGAAALALLWSIGGPLVADGATPYPFGSSSTLGVLVWLVVVVVIVAAAFSPAPAIAARPIYASLCIWLVPSAIVWVVYRTDLTRLLSPGWPPLMLLAALSFGEAVCAVSAIGWIRPRGVAAGAAAATSVALVVLNLSSIDSLGAGRWHDLIRMGRSSWSNAGGMRLFVTGPFVYEVEAVQQNLRPGELVFTSDSRLGYFAPGRLTGGYPTSCGGLAGSRVFVLLLDGEAADYEVRVMHGSVDPLAWLQCTRPRLEEVAERPGVFAVFVVGGAPLRPPTPDACGIGSTPGTAYDAVLVHDLRYAAAKRAYQQAVRSGFAGARIERIGCDSFRVVIAGVPTPTDAIRTRARGAGFPGASIEPANRFQWVAPDVPAMR